MRIVKLEAENVKRLKAVTITPQGNLVVIGGRNAQGKTSVLDAIQYALGGKAGVATRPVRDGEESAQVILELDDLIITRTFTADGKTALKVTAKDGAAYGSPQTILDKLVGNLTFDPLAFSRMDEKAQLATLKQLVGLDFAGMDAKRDTAYAQRTEANRVLKSLEAQLKAAPVVNAPDEPVSITALVDEQRRAMDAHETYRQNVGKLTDRTLLLSQSRTDYAAREKEISDLQTQITEIQDVQKRAAPAIKKENDVLDAMRNDISAVENALPNLNFIGERIGNAEGINKNVAARNARAELTIKVATQKKISGDLTTQIDAIDIGKRAAIAGAKFPLDGIGVDDDGVTFSGLPFSQASGAEKLRVSTALGLAMNPQLKIMLIRDGSLLDAENLELMGEIATDADAQLWIERVGKGQEASVIIEDGLVEIR